MRVKSFLVASCSLQILALSYIASFDWAPGLIKCSQVFWFCLNIDRWRQIMIYFRRAECQFPDSRHPQDGSVGQKSFHRFLAKIFVHRASAAPADDGWPSRCIAHISGDQRRLQYCLPRDSWGEKQREQATEPCLMWRRRIQVNTPIMIYLILSIMFCTLSKCRDNAPNNAIVQAGAPRVTTPRYTSSPPSRCSWTSSWLN